MHITKLALDHFRSWNHLVVDLGPGVTIFQGANGLGKTNIVEAIEVLSTGSSHRTSSSLPLVERGATTATIRANVMRHGNHYDHGDIDASDAGNVGPTTNADGGAARTGHSDISTYELTIRAKGANRGRVNGGSSIYIRDIVGKIPSVTFAPEDQRLIESEPSLRRGFLDQACTLLIPGYAERLQQFTKTARQRAALLRTIGTSSPDDPRCTASLGTLEIWTGQFIAAGIAVTRDRAAVVTRLQEPFSRLYDELASGNGVASLQYEPSFDEVQLSDDPGPLISRHFQRLFAGETSRGINLIGPQRDDMAVLLDDMPAREFASNGEMWTMALALKMALYETVREERDLRPIVILDDVFAQLDEQRRERILEFASRQDQVFITVAAASDIPMFQHARVIDVEHLREQQHGPQATGSGDLDELVAHVAASRTGDGNIR